MPKQKTALLAFLLGAGFLAGGANPLDTRRQIAVTIDDLPFVGYGAAVREVKKGTRAILAALARHRVQAVGFVTGKNLFVPGEIDRRLSLLQSWLSAGHQLGNHTFGHLDFNQESLAGFGDDIVRGELALQLAKLPPAPSPRYFRFPMNHTGDTREKRDAVAQYLSERGYTAVPFTIENEDYLFAKAYALAQRKKDRGLAERLGRSYLDFTDIKTEYAEKAAERLWKRPVPQVLLIHANRLNARLLDRLLARLRQRGYAFISLEEALLDPVYARPPDYAGKFGPSWLARWALEQGMMELPRQEPDAPGWVGEAAKD